MVGNGIRTLRIVDWEEDSFVQSVAEVRRLRCAACGTTANQTFPTTEEGFRMSVEAADRVVERVLAAGLATAAEEAGMDRASVSRLIATRADRRLERTERPRLARMDLVAPGILCVADAATGLPAAFFSGCDDGRLLPWLSRPYPAVLVPDRNTLAAAMRWEGFRIAVDGGTAAAMARAVMARAALRCGRSFPASVAASARLARLLATSRAVADIAEDVTFAHVETVGPRLRHFMRMVARLEALLLDPEANPGNADIARWKADCGGIWSEVFQPVLVFLDTFAAVLFRRPGSFEPLELDPALRPPAGVMSLGLDHPSGRRPFPSKPRNGGWKSKTR